MKKLLLFLIIGLWAGLITSCSDDDDSDDASPANSNLTLDINGLQDLGSDYVYEGWIIVDGSPVTTGTFTVDGSGSLSATSFSVDAAKLASATDFVISIEPAQDPDPAPAPTKIMIGTFSRGSATLSTNTVGSDFESSTGKYIVATPTSSMGGDTSGIWFLDNSTGTMMPGLDLPTLTDGWKYEGWVVVDGTPGTLLAV